MRSHQILKSAMLCLGLAVTCSPGWAQGTNVAFAGLKTDISQPVQVDADQLSVNQQTGMATFSGNVIVVQGDMRLQAGEVVIVYSADNRAIQSLRADGGVTLAAGTDAATADSAEYSPDTGDLVLIGKVVLTQGAAALSGEKLTLSLKSGTGTMSGRVTTIFTPGNN